MLSIIIFLCENACRASLSWYPVEAYLSMLLGLSNSQLSKALMPQLLGGLAPRASPACSSSAAAQGGSWAAMGSGGGPAQKEAGKKGNKKGKPPVAARASLLPPTPPVGSAAAEAGVGDGECSTR